VLSADEVVRFLEAIPSLKSRTALTTVYAAGLRVSEVVLLKIADIDSQRMVIRVEQGKGGKDRYVMLSPQLLRILGKVSLNPLMILVLPSLFIWSECSVSHAFNVELLIALKEELSPHFKPNGYRASFGSRHECRNSDACFGFQHDPLLLTYR